MWEVRRQAAADRTTPSDSAAVAKLPVEGRRATGSPTSNRASGDTSSSRYLAVVQTRLRKLLDGGDFLSRPHFRYPPSGEPE
jgi:hypothetical protein